MNDDCVTSDSTKWSLSSQGSAELTTRWCHLSEKMPEDLSYTSINCNTFPNKLPCLSTIDLVTNTILYLSLPPCSVRRLWDLQLALVFDGLSTHLSACFDANTSAIQVHLERCRSSWTRPPWHNGDLSTVTLSRLYYWVGCFSNGWLPQVRVSIDTRSRSLRSRLERLPQLQSTWCPPRPQQPE